MHNYSISGWCHDENKRLIAVRVRSSAMVAEFKRLAVEVPAWLTDFLNRGCRYSNEDFDVLTGAMRELEKLQPNVWTRIGTIEAH
jgi:hypothetical protein